jgi:hypothetical protein
MAQFLYRSAKYQLWQLICLQNSGHWPSCDRSESQRKKKKSGHTSVTYMTKHLTSLTFKLQETAHISRYILHAAYLTWLDKFIPEV